MRLILPLNKVTSPTTGFFRERINKNRPGGVVIVLASAASWRVAIYHRKNPDETHSGGGGALSRTHTRTLLQPLHTATCPSLFGPLDSLRRNGRPHAFVFADERGNESRNHGRHKSSSTCTPGQDADHSGESKREREEKGEGKKEDKDGRQSKVGENLRFIGQWD